MFMAFVRATLRHTTQHNEEKTCDLCARVLKSRDTPRHKENGDLLRLRRNLKSKQSDAASAAQRHIQRQRGSKSSDDQPTAGRIDQQTIQEVGEEIIGVFCGCF